MPSNNRKQYTAEFKLKVVLESLQRDTTIETVKKKFNVHTTQINNWRRIFWKQASQIAVTAFNPTNPSKSNQDKNSEDLTRLIGQLTIENEILKKALGSFN
jgi:transposase